MTGLGLVAGGLDLRQPFDQAHLVFLVCDLPVKGTGLCSRLGADILITMNRPLFCLMNGMHRIL